ncbi:hypothetical protein [Streptosporangium amethystogenes]|uniref:hypothetical protein n=1 Tax=Streptosporangium amethystogenes TaxID=2002 RepID=UPI0004C9F976|nr:hypothetical protein [Streptosporangium amethystogenes]
MYKNLTALFRETDPCSGSARPVRSAVDCHGIIDTDHLLTCLRIGSLRYPYFSVFHVDDAVGEVPAVETRVVAGGGLCAEFADLDKVEQELGEGAFLKLSQLSHWHPQVRAITQGLSRDLSAAVASRMYWARMDGAVMTSYVNAPAFIVQLHGEAIIRCGSADRGATENGSWEVNLKCGELAFLTTPCSFSAQARGESCQLLIQISAPRVRDYLKALKACTMVTNSDLVSCYHTMSVDERSIETKKALMATAGKISSERLLALTLSMMKEEAG